MQQTTNYNLKKIELTDSPPDITVINPNWDTIDTAIKAVDNSLVEHKAEPISYHSLIGRDLSIAGVQSIAVPFKPKAMTVNAAVDRGVRKASWGMVGANQQSCIADFHNVEANSYHTYLNKSIAIFDSATNYTFGVITITETGFDITWEKIGSGATGSVTLNYLATTHE